jgi:hypothetical protein
LSGYITQLCFYCCRHICYSSNSKTSCSNGCVGSGIFTDQLRSVQVFF